MFETYGLFVRVRPWPRAPLRPPGRPHSADLRRHDAQRVRQQQHPDRPAARLSVPVVDSARRVAGQQRRPAAHARPRLAVELSRRQLRRRARDCRSSTPAGGTPASRRTASSRCSNGPDRSAPARCRIRGCATTTAAASWPAGWSPARTPALQLGASASTGAWLNESLEDGGRRSRRRSRARGRSAFGGDAEYLGRRRAGPRRGHPIDVGHAAGSAPLDRRAAGRHLGARRRPLQGGARVLPGAARRSRSTSARCSASRQRNTWDADTWRVEAGGGYSMTRNIMVKGIVAAEPPRRRTGDARRPRRRTGAVLVLRATSEGRDCGRGGLGASRPRGGRPLPRPPGGRACGAPGAVARLPTSEASPTSGEPRAPRAARAQRAPSGRRKRAGSPAPASAAVSTFAASRGPPSAGPTSRRRARRDRAT